MSKIARLQYVGNVKNGMSLTLFGTYKSVTIAPDKDYIFTDNDRLDEIARDYYKSLRPLDVVFHYKKQEDPTEDSTEDSTEEVVEELLEDTPSEVEEEVVETANDTPDKEESTENVLDIETLPTNITEEVSNKLYSMEDDKALETLNSIGFSSRKRSVSSKIYEALQDSDVVSKLYDKLFRVVDVE